MSAWVVLDLVVKATLVLGTGLAAGRALSTGPAAVRHALLVATVAAAAALPALQVTLPDWNVPLRERTASIAVAPIRTPMPEPSASSVASPSPRSDARMSALAEPLSPPPSRSARFPWQEFLLAVWAAGALFVLARFAIDTMRTRALVRDAVQAPDGPHARLAARVAEGMGVQRRVQVLFSERLSVPVTWGILRPVVVLPLEAWEWPADRIRIVLLHEIAHVRRLDCLSAVVVVLASSLWWFHPLLWLCRRRLRVEQERACDDVVLLGGVGATVYASMLVDFARGVPSYEEVVVGRSAIAMARRSTLRDRVETILATGSRSLRLERRSAALLALLVVTLLLPLAAVRVWGETSEKRRVSEAIADLESPEADAREAAAWRLGTLEAEEAAGPLSARLADPDPGVRGVAARSLGRIGGPDAFPLIAQLLDDHDPVVRELAILGLEATGSEEVVPAVIPMLADPEMSVRSVAVSALGHAEGREAARALAETVVSDPDAHTRGMAAGALAKRTDEADLAVPAVVHLLMDPDPNLRAEAAWSLAQLGSDAAVPGLAEHFAHESDAEVRREVVDALGAFPHHPVAVEVLLDALRDSDPEVRTKAAMGLAGSDEPAAAVALVEALRDPVHQVRLQAAWALDEIEARR